MNVSIEIDKNSLNKVNSSFKKLVNDIESRASGPLRESAQIVVDESQRNFDTQGFLYGRSWSPLRPSTVKQRARRGLGARPILIVSGKLKRGAGIDSVTNKEAVVRNRVSYAKYHQFGTSRMVKREVLRVTDRAKRAIGLVFSNYIARIIKGL